MQDGTFSVNLVSGMPVVAVPEEIDVTNASHLRAALLKAAAAGSGTLVADMSRTEFCDSSGVHVLVATHRRAQAEGGELRLVISSAAVLRIFAITGIDRVIPNFTRLADALAHTGDGPMTDVRTAPGDNGHGQPAPPPTGPDQVTGGRLEAGGALVAEHGKADGGPER